MNTEQEKNLRPDHDPLTEPVIGSVFKVAHGLGSGFLEDAHTAQSLNYLKATGLPTCLLVNFGTPRPQIKRLSH